MKILVTGGSGFVGGETIKLLRKETHEIFNYDLMLGYDIRDLRQLELVVNEYKPDRILHLAAIARFADADANPQLAFETNAMGTANVSKVANKYHVPLVYSSTGSTYMPITDFNTRITEDFPAKGNSVYGCSKYAGETYIRMVNPHIVLRYGHLLGAEKRMHGLIGGYLDRIDRGLAPTLYGGQQSNSFTYIKDIARANLLALTAPWDAWNQTFNIGSPEEITAEVAGQMVCDIFGYKGKVEKKPMRTVDPLRFWFDTTKAEKMLHFKAEYTLRDGLLDMAEIMGYNQSNDSKGTEPLPKRLARKKSGKNKVAAQHMVRKPQKRAKAKSRKG